MKTICMPVAMIMVFVLILGSSCNSGKKIQTASTPAEKKQKEAVSSKKSKTVAPQKKSTTTLPSDVKNNFTSRYPLAKNVSWKTYPDLTNTEKSTTNYSAMFVENGKTNWIIYSEKGDIVEERKQIEIDQLPQNIYNAVKEKYPTYKIVSAATYTHINKEGSYVVLLKPLSENDAKEIEVIFRENASQVE